MSPRLSAPDLMESISCKVYQGEHATGFTAARRRQMAACAAFFKESRMKFADSRNSGRKSRDRIYSCAAPTNGRVCGFLLRKAA